MSTLPSAPCLVEYNGVRFGVETSTEACDITPVYSQDGRVVKYVRYDLVIFSVLGQSNQERGQTTDLDMEALRKRLTAPAAPFVYQGVGLGRLRINVPGERVKDVEWGPRPLLLQWKPIGQLACEVRWRVSIAIPECDLATYEFELMELCWKLSWSVDASGYTTRTYSGFLRIPQTRKSKDDRTLSDQADAYRERIYPPPLVGFRRTPGTFEMNEAKTELRFTVTDQEIGPYYPPEGVVEVSMSQDVQSVSTPYSVYGGRWLGTLTATYEVARDVDRRKALKYFLEALFGRTRRAALVRRTDGKRCSALIVSFRASHPEIYGKKGASFSATWTILSQLQDLAKTSGLWASPPGSDPEKWATSLANTAFHLRGNAKLGFSRGGDGQFQDAIVDLCVQNQQAAPPRHAESPEAPDYVPEEEEPRNELPPPESSWLEFGSVIEFEPHDDLPAIKLLPKNRLDPLRTLSTAPPDAETSDERTLSTDVSKDEGARVDPELTFNLARHGAMAVYPEEADQARSRYVAQYRNTPETYVVLTGEAVRAGYEVTPPAVLSVGGCDVVPANVPGRHEFRRAVLGSLFGVTVYACTWSLRYRVLGVPRGNLAQMNTPFLEPPSVEPPAPPGP